MRINYREGADISVANAIDLYRRSTLGDRRPVERPEVFEGLLEHNPRAWALSGRQQAGYNAVPERCGLLY